METLTISIRFALYVNVMLLFGLPLFALSALRGSERLHGNVLPLRAMILALSALAIALSILSIFEMTAAMAGVSLPGVDSAAVKSMILETPMGTAWAARIVALICTLLIALTLGRRETAKWLAAVSLGAGVALGSLAWTGHGAASEGIAGTGQLVADIVHLIAAGAWIGALVALGSMVFRPANTMSTDHIRVTHRALEGFSVIGTIIVALIVISGLVNSWMLVGPAHLLSMALTLYGQLLIAKLVLFGLMLGLAAANRFRLTPALALAIASGDSVSAFQKLRQSVIFEAALAMGVLAIVAWLGTLEPPMSM